MNITWTTLASGSIQTPYKNTLSKYQLFQTKILQNTVSVNVLQSPETKSLLIEHDGKPARLHLGMPRSVDLCAATYTIASTDEFKKSINHKYNPSKEALSAMLIREPITQSPFVNTYMGSGFESRLYVIMDVHHVKDEENGVKGIAGKVCNYKIDLPQGQETEILKDIKLAIMYDSIAAGRNLIAGIEDLKKKCPNLEKVVTVSVYATYTGCERLAKACHDLGLEVVMFCMHELLDASVINEYDSFYPEWNISKSDEKLMQKFYGKNYHKICVGGDWSANTLGSEQALDVFKQQLKEIDIDPKIFELEA